MRLTYTTIYPPNWRKVSLTIRRLAGNRCEWCGCETGRLSVHHVGAPYADGRAGSPRDKHDCRRENLAALCEACHDQADHLSEIRERKQRQLHTRQIKVARHRALGIGTGLIVVEEERAA